MGYRARLRTNPTPAELKVLYNTPHQHERWHDHHARVDVTIAIAHWVHEMGTSVADLSCGDAAIADSLVADASQIYLGDIAPGYDITGPIEQTLPTIPRVGTFICSETLEHLEYPDETLYQIRMQADRLILSTPIGERGNSNPEHIWGWDTDTIEQMLNMAGWRPIVCNKLELREYFYDFQIWGCR